MGMSGKNEEGQGMYEENVGIPLRRLDEEPYI